MRRAAVFAGSVLVDARLGDPPNALHPVALIGRAVHALESRAPDAPAERRRFGLRVAAGLPAVAALIAAACPRLIGRRAQPARLAAEIALLSLTTAQRTLFARAAEVRDALASGRLDDARSLAAAHLVSRDTGDLTATEVAAAAIESVAENLSDGVIAPWLAYAGGGLPAAWAYRAANTLDAMWGYRDARYEQLGRGAARLDDALNFVPARVTALAICLAAPLAGGDARRAFAAWRRDGGRTASPNAGRPMAAMAGALGVELAKPGAYALGGGGRAPAADDITRAIAIARRAAIYAAFACAVAALTRGGAR